MLDILVQSRRNRRTAIRFFRTLLKRQGRLPHRLITDKLRSYLAARRTVMPSVVHVTAQYANNRAEVSHQPTRQRERQMRRFTSAAHLPTLRVGAGRGAESLPGGAASLELGPPPPPSHTGSSPPGRGPHRPRPPVNGARLAPMGPTRSTGLSIRSLSRTSPTSRSPGGGGRSRPRSSPGAPMCGSLTRTGLTLRGQVSEVQSPVC